MFLTLFLPCAAVRVAPPVMQLRGGVPYAPQQQQTAPASTAGTAGFSGGVVPTSTAQGSLQQKVETLRSQLNLASGQSLRQTIAEAVRTIGLDADVKSLNERARQATPARGYEALSRRMREFEQSSAVDAAASVATPVYEWTTNEALFTPPTDTQISGMMRRIDELSKLTATGEFARNHMRDSSPRHASLAEETSRSSGKQLAGRNWKSGADSLAGSSSMLTPR